MSSTKENPMGLCGFEFVEFSAPKSDVIEPVLALLGFTKVATHRSKQVELYRQGQINFIVNNEPKSLAYYFAMEHGPSVCSMAFRVEDSAYAYKRALELGALTIDTPTGVMELRLPAIKGIGGAPLYLIDRFKDGESIYDIDFKFIEGVDHHPRGHGFTVIDHLTHNVYRGRMKYWADFYEKLFNFKEYRYFDIKGEYSGLNSKAMAAPDGQIFIPLNEEAVQSSGQIEEYLMEYNGEGIQHIALRTDNLISSLDSMIKAGLEMMPKPPHTYYELLDQRIPNHGETVSELEKRGILLDGAVSDGKKDLLLQIFSKNLLGPVFFEFIQRKGNKGFGEGNFKALFESIELDQVQRGLFKPT